jgi:UDP-N-acetylmuramoyl-L-alanyl-D-glutamate--2,6-diaminopimelate ligase
MTLRELAKQIGALNATGYLEAEVRDVTHDSRTCEPGSLFVAMRGQKFDANQFVPEAVARGAVGIVSEDASLDRTPAWIQVKDARAALALASAAVHGHPSLRLKLVGITGTNGKTTTAHLVDSIIRAAEGRSAMIGTISYKIADQLIPAQHTTPEASDIQRLLARAVAAGINSAVIEVSSHALELRRADQLKFAAAVFTNLTRDHLDYHETMENYFAAKRKLFDGSLGRAPDSSIVNLDDEYGQRLLEHAKGRIMTYGFGSGADVRAEDFQMTRDRLHMLVATPVGPMRIESSLVGKPHAYNVLAAIAAGLALGFKAEDIARGISALGGVPGRFERIDSEAARQLGITVVVDYAHTDDALRNVLQTARQMTSGRLITVFGCGGNRDRTKRAPMGDIAASLSDLTIVTSDNPRMEDPEAIIRDIEVGIAGRPHLKIIDRREAILRAIAEAQPGDLVLIAGKGHETYQILGDQKIHFDDRQVALEALERARSL